MRHCSSSATLLKSEGEGESDECPKLARMAGAGEGPAEPPAWCSPLSTSGRASYRCHDTGAWEWCAWERPLRGVCSSEKLDSLLISASQIGFGQEVLSGILCNYEKNQAVDVF